MSDDIWELFPLPTMTEIEILDGSFFPKHPDCISCAPKFCLSSQVKTPPEIETCRFGLNFIKIDDVRVTNGFLVSGLQNIPKKLQRRLRQEPLRHIRAQNVITSISKIRVGNIALTKSFKRDVHLAAQSIGSNPEIFDAVAEIMSGKMEKNFERNHDLLQLIKLIQEYAEAILLRIKDDDPETVAALPENKNEGAIYFASKLMQVKIDAWKFNANPSLAQSGSENFKIHPLVLKYVRIYNWRATQRDCRIVVSGESRSECLYNPDAVGTVIQAVIDNMVKYAPSSSKCDVIFEENDHSTLIVFSSLGPKIEPEEFGTIFLTGVRGRAAVVADRDGQGVGLGLAKSISNSLGLSLNATQDSSADGYHKNYFKTTFTVKLVTKRS